MCTKWQATPRIQACAFLTGLSQEISLISLAQAAIQQNNFTAGWESLGDPGSCAVQAKCNLGVPYQIRTAFVYHRLTESYICDGPFSLGEAKLAAETLMDNLWFMYMWAKRTAICTVLTWNQALETMSICLMNKVCYTKGMSAMWRSCHTF